MSLLECYLDYFFHSNNNIEIDFLTHRAIFLGFEIDPRDVEEVDVVVFVGVVFGKEKALWALSSETAE